MQLQQDRVVCSLMMVITHVATVIMSILKLFLRQFYCASVGKQINFDKNLYIHFCVKGKISHAQIPYFASVIHPVRNVGQVKIYKVKSVAARQ